MKRNIKVVFAVILALTFLFATACSSDPTVKPEETPTPTVKATDDATPTPDNTPEATPKATPAPTKEVEEIRPASKEPVKYEVPSVGENGYINLLPLYPSRNARTIGVTILDDPLKANSLFDGTAEKYFCLNDNTSVEIHFIANAPIRADYVSFTSANDASGLPVSFSLYGYKDNSMKEGSLLYSTESLVIPAENFTESELFKTENTGYYMFFKLVINSVNGGSKINMGELTLYADPAISESCIGNYPVYNCSFDGYTVLSAHIKPKLTLMDPGHEGGSPKNLFDCNIETYDDMTTQWASDYESLSYTFSMDGEIQIDAYRFTVGAFYGTPCSWKIYGSNDKKLRPESETLIDEKNDIGMPLWDYGESDIFAIDNPGAYKYYRLEITKGALVGNDENWLSVSFREFTPLAKK